jgi:hypothetical protein
MMMLRRGILLHRRAMGAALLAALGAAGCAETAPEGDAAAKAAQAQDYPDLSTVPPRPRLTYTVQQRRQIADALVSDRDHARYLRDVLRYDTGQSHLPPPPAPPPRVAEPAPGAAATAADGAPRPAPQVSGGGTFAERYVNQAILTETNDGSLDDFLRILERQQTVIEAAEEAGAEPPPAGDMAAPGELGGDTGPPAAGPVPIVPPEAGAGATAAAPAPPPAAVATADSPALAGRGSLLLRVPFAPASAQAPEALAAELGPLVAQVNEARGRLALVGRGADPGLGHDRARAVAQVLVRLGVAADRLAIRGGGAGEEVLVYLLPGGAA